MKIKSIMRRVVITPIYNFFVCDILGEIKDRGIWRSQNDQELSLLKNKHNNERCFIIGSGPSLRIEDLDILYEKKEKTISCNRMYQAFNLTKWRPDYMCIVDEPLMKKIYKDLLSSDISIVLTTKQIKKYISSKFNGKLPKKVLGTTLKCNFTYPFKRKFSGNALKYTYPARTVATYMIEMAVYMGFKEIYLIGIDCNYAMTKTKDGKIVEQVGQKNYFLDSYAEQKSIDIYNDHNYIFPDFEAAKKYANAHKIKIYNATRGGKLEIFDRICLDKIFENSSINGE
ncbi:6-hydroxymethylpterin diphosphokinase MptE-like protein [Niameybacter massiliensis]|uniref:6-hydroxymethylpterin diphosphokinase MptE-like protein n=1 Tax=Niameybacter massiliensis TaxID=1658108 RepID=UPI0006B52F55|nr:6-hydroxymethylpterin diphosphokinase MptE-like protein [Niameybacter massiliensis]